MDYLQRSEAARQKRINEKARKLEAHQLRIATKRNGQGALAVLPPQFDANNMIDPTLFKGDQKGVAQPVLLLGYDFPSDDPFDEDEIIFQRKRSSESDADYKQLGAKQVVSDVYFPHPVTMPQEYMNDEGEFDFRFVVFPVNGEDTAGYPSPSTRVTLDWTSPAGTAIPDKAQVPRPANGLIDTVYLNSLPGGELTVTIPAYAHRDATDRIAWAWLSALPDGANLPPGQSHIEPLPDSHEIKVPAQVIQSAGEGDGHCYFVYLLLDRALNQSKLSDFEPIRISLGNAPGPVNEPTVPLADGPDGLSYADLSLGVDVLIPLLVEFRYSDQIVVTWGSTDLPPRQVGDGGFPMGINVPPSVIREEYERAGSGQVTTPVSYRVMRGVNPWPSPSIDVQVDLSLIGPPNPDWPSPVNPDLPRLTVKSFTGEDNVIEGDANIGQPATVEFELYNPVTEDAVIQLYWKHEPVGTPYQVTASDTPGTPISIEVSWADISRLGDDLSLPVQYSIRSATGMNEVCCIAEPVRVLIVPIALAAPHFPQTVAPNHFLNCPAVSPDRGRVKVAIPFDAEYVHDGVNVHVWWKGFERVPPGSGNPPAPGNPVPASDFDVVIPWVEDASLRGHAIAWVEPAEDRLFTLHPADSGYGFCKCYYTVQINGRTITSAPVETRVAMGTPNGLCDLS